MILNIIYIITRTFIEIINAILITLGVVYFLSKLFKIMDLHWVTIITPFLAAMILNIFYTYLKKINKKR